MTYIIKKIVASLVCVGIITACLLIPQKTYAIPVVDGPLNGLTAANMATTAANWITQLAKWAKDELAKTLRDNIVKALVDEINKQTVAWIQGNGSPRFVDDWKGFLEDAAMEGVNQTISQSQMADLCVPFAFQLQIALIPETRPISQKAKCTISDIVANVEDFYENFENGGWLAYGEALKPENNLYMQLAMFDDDMKIRSSATEEKKKQEAGAGSGFLSVSKCTEDDAQALYDECVAFGGDPAVECYDYADQNKTCTKEQVQTPGDAVAGTVKNLIGSDNEWAAGVQSIISAAINAGINRMMSEGLSLMTGTAPSGSGYNPSQEFQDDLDALTTDTKSDLIDQVQPYYDLWKEILDIKNESATYNAQIVSNLGAIKIIQERLATIPSPNVFVVYECPPNVTDNDLSNARTVGDVLAATIAGYQVKFDEVNALIAQINAADLTKTRDLLLVKEALETFQEKYTLATEGINLDPNAPESSIVITAKSEATALRGDLDLVLTRLTTCRTVESTAPTSQ